MDLLTHKTTNLAHHDFPQGQGLQGADPVGAHSERIHYDVSLLKLLGMRLESRGFRVTTAESGREALKALELDRPHLVLTDQRIDEIVEEISMNLESRDMKLADYLKNIGQTEEQLRKNYEKTAEEQVRQGLVLETIAEKEELDVTNQDLSMEVYSMAHQFNADPKDVMKIIKEEGRVNMLINSVLRKKAAAFIYGAAKKAEADKKEAEEAPAAEAAAPKTEEDFNAMTVKDLKAYAQEKGIAIESKAKKAEIIDTIMAAEKE